MASNQQISLLGVPAGVENLILSFVASGNGGLKRILNLRKVCKDTKSWVDNLPKRQADSVFSRAQVRLKSDLKSLRRFTSSAPPFGITTLSLGRKCVHSGDSQEKETVWRAFFTFWNSKLETLELRDPEQSFDDTDEDDEESVDGSFMDNITAHRSRLCQTMELPNVQRLFIRGDVDLDEEIQLPLCFQKVTELHIKYFGDEGSHRDEFRLQLENNDNLRLLSVDLEIYHHLFQCAKLIDRKKDDISLQLSLECSFMDNWNRKHVMFNQAFRQLAESIVASRSKIRIQLGEICGLETLEKLITDLLPPVVRLKLFTTIESVDEWTPKTETMTLLENLTILEKLETILTYDSNVDFNRLIFPPSLKKIGLSFGFPARANLPKSLTSLSLHDYACDPGCLLDSLKYLARHCPKLEELQVGWSPLKENNPNFNLEPLTQEFSKLRTLGFYAKSLDPTDITNYRALLVNAFDWRNLELKYLSLSFEDYKRRKLRVVDEGILTQICEGLSKKRLLTVHILKKSVTREALPFWDRLQSLVCANQQQ